MHYRGRPSVFAGAPSLIWAGPRALVWRDRSIRKQRWGFANLERSRWWFDVKIPRLWSLVLAYFHRRIRSSKLLLGICVNSEWGSVISDESSRFAARTQITFLNWEPRNNREYVYKVRPTIKTIVVLFVMNLSSISIRYNRTNQTKSTDSR